MEIKSLILREMEGGGEGGFKNVLGQIWREPSLWEGESWGQKLSCSEWPQAVP